MNFPRFLQFLQSSGALIKGLIQNLGVGIGSVLSAWSGSAVTEYQLPGVQGFAGALPLGMFVGDNCYFDGTDIRYKAAGAATLFVQTSSGSFEFISAPDGLADAIIDPGDNTVLSIGSNGSVICHSSGQFSASQGQFLKLIGGTAVTDILKLQGTSGNGTATSAAIQGLVGNNGGTVAYTVLNNGNVGIGTTDPGALLSVNGDALIHGITVGNGSGSGGSQSSVLGSGALVSNTTGALNVAIGYNTLAVNMAGNYNTAVGWSALTYSVGDHNAALGAGALNVNTASYNTAVGSMSLPVNTSGPYNTALGYLALSSETIGSHNTGLGAGAGAGLVEGANNTLVGFHSMGGVVTSGSYNVVVGNTALYNNLGDRNVALGYSAGYNETGSNTFYVNNIEEGSSDNDKKYSLLYGTFSGTAGSLTGQKLVINGNVGIGTTGPTAFLHLKAGAAAVSSAPLKFTTGVLQTTSEAGAYEFAGDLYYQTITTNATRRVQVAAQSGRSVGATAAVASVVTFTLGAADASFEVCANVLVTTATTHSFNVTLAYTDEGNTARSVTLNFSTLAGVISNAAITNIGGTVPYEGVPMHIRCKASTAITIATAGTFTTTVYNVEANIKQIA